MLNLSVSRRRLGKEVKGTDNFWLASWRVGDSEVPLIFEILESK